ncbi:hypothetical protein AA313_de0203888 [Arthrobotrys entomopaga]|nr:hypothetical protein AA313_de0203888 [Arthrobotrys entomopaga]
METKIKVKAGRCFPDPNNPRRITPSDVPGEIQIVFSRDEELLHFKWVPRSGRTVEGEEFDLIVFPGDASFVRYDPDGIQLDGRILVLKFLSSDQRHFFWFQKLNSGLEPGLFTSQDTLDMRKIDR